MDVYAVNILKWFLLSLVLSAGLHEELTVALLLRCVMKAGPTVATFLQANCIHPSFPLVTNLRDVVSKK